MSVLAATLALVSVVSPVASTARAAAPLPELLTQLPPDGKIGSTAGRLSGPRGIATSPVNGHIYVTDTVNHRISEFTAWGTFVKAWGWGVADGVSSEPQTCATSCFPGIAGSGAGQFASPTGVAVDSTGAIYVVDIEAHRVEKFSPSGAFLLMFGGEVDKTTKANLCTQADLEHGDECGAGTTGAGDGQFGEWPSYTAFIAVGPQDVIYVGGDERIQEFGAGGDYKSQIATPGNTVLALAVDSSGDIYVSFRDIISRAKPDVEKLSPVGALLGTLAVETPDALATDANGDVYVSERRITSHGPEAEEVLEFGSEGAPIITPGAGFAGVNDTFGEDIGGLATNGVGDVLVASAEHSGSGASYVRVYGPPPITLELPPAVAPDVTAEYAASVDPEDGVVRAQINPFFWPDAKYYVQYGLGDCAEGGCVDRPVAPGSLLTARSVKVPVTTGDIHLTGLLPDTTYHYRFVAQSGGGGPVYGPDRTFTTFPSQVAPDQVCGNAAFRVGASASLVDCRAFEMVSPTDKNGGDARALPSVSGSAVASLDEGSASGDKMTYSAYRAFGDAQSAPYSVQYVARRQEGSGWSSHAISPPRELSRQAGGPPVFADTPYRAFSPDLSQAWLLQDTDPVLAPGGVPGYVDLYRQDNLSRSYEALTTVSPPHQPKETFAPEFQGASADGRHAIFRVADNLTPEAPALGHTQLYESTGGQLHLVSILPDGTPNKVLSSAGAGGFIENGRESAVEHAISDDGSRIFWTSEAIPQDKAGRVFVRVNPDQEQSVIEEGECVEPARACTVAVSQSVSAANARFWLASADGSRVVFSFVEGPHAGDLYEFDVDARQSVLIAHKVLGVAGASEDASRVYFVSAEAIAGTSGAIEGQPNLYVHDGETTGFIATLSNGDVSGGGLSSIAASPEEHYARVTPDGRDLVFVSKGSLTGYDSLDANSGQADLEVYRYDLESKRLDCVSCNRTGARPAGRYLRERWVAGLVPTWENQLYQARYVSDDGNRVFFESFDALVPQDNNGKEDVYEWEAPGTGECTQQAASYSPPNGGCVSLTSTGESSQDSEFVDASPSGDDVFVRTISSLVSQDTGLYDIYDARVNGGFASPVAAAECEGEACQNPPLPPTFTTPASVSFNGTGNLVSALPAAVAPRSRPLTRAQKLARALRACKSKPARKRTTCRAHAHKRYPPTATRSSLARTQARTLGNATQRRDPHRTRE